MIGIGTNTMYQPGPEGLSMRKAIKKGSVILDTSENLQTGEVHNEVITVAEVVSFTFWEEEKRFGYDYQSYDWIVEVKGSDGNIWCHRFGVWIRERGL
jgi:hypothetical protein